VELHLEEGATLCFSERPSDYLPRVPTSWQGVEMSNLSPLVYAAYATNVSITGKGALKTGNAEWNSWFRKNSGNRRPQFVQFFCCGNVRLEGFSIRGSPFWTIHLYRTDDAVVKGLDVSAFDDQGFAMMNSDGIDIECSRRVKVVGCTFRQGDDAIVIKSGRDEDGIRRGIPTEDVLIEGCRVREGHTLLGIGSEVGGGIRNVTMRDCTVEGAVNRLLFVKTNAKRGGFIENIVLERVRADKVRYALVGLMADYWYYPPPGASNLHRTPIRGVIARRMTAGEVGSVVELRGDPALPARDFTVSDVTVERVRAKVVEAVNVENLRVDGLVVRHPPVVQFKKDDPSRGGQEK
jgi:polygalacturonase